ncbi:hypothetical protein GO286_02519 [Ralstonia solanacearum]|nr:hypothetical protein [Ralstonia solanacearum]
MSRLIIFLGPKLHKRPLTSYPISKQMSSLELYGFV